MNKIDLKVKEYLERAKEIKVFLRKTTEDELDSIEDYEIVEIARMIQLEELNSLMRKKKI